MRLCVWISLFVCVCVCVYDCLGSQRVTEPEFDEGTAVVSKGGWGLFPSFICSVSQSLFSFVVLFWMKFCWISLFLH